MATADGKLHEIFYSPKMGKENAGITFFCGMRFLTVFYTLDNNYQHPVVATEMGNIFEIFYKLGNFHITRSLTNFPRMVTLSAFYTADDQICILIASQPDGSIN